VNCVERSDLLTYLNDIFQIRTMWQCLKHYSGIRFKSFGDLNLIISKVKSILQTKFTGNRLLNNVNLRLITETKEIRL